MRLISNLAALGALPVLLAFAPSDVESAAPLAAALDSVSERNISADIQFIASDELQGRDTPSPGLKIAARFIRSRLAALGIEPGAQDGYFYEYPLDFARIDGEKTMAMIGEKELIEGQDYATWFRTSESSDVSAPMTWVGLEGADAFEGLELDGHWAVCADDEEYRWRRTRSSAQKAGAMGVLCLVEAESDTFSMYSKAVQRALQGSVTFPRPKKEGEEEDKTPRRRSSIPVVHVTFDAFQAATGMSVDTLEKGKALDMSFRDVRSPDENVQQVMLENVCGFWPGSDPKLSKEVIIISAHYDHVGARDGEVYNGADDNGSGTTGLLALAEALTNYGKLRRSVMVMWVSGEEKGLYGSKAWTLNPWLPEGYVPVANINIDMIGRNAPDSLLVTPTEKHEEYNGLTRLAERLAPLEGFETLGDADAYYERSDHYNFRKNLEIPVAFLFSDVHEDYHKPTDTPDKIDCDKIRRVARLVMRMLDGMQEDVLQF